MPKPEDENADGAAGLVSRADLFFAAAPNGDDDPAALPKGDEPEAAPNADVDDDAEAKGDAFALNAPNVA